MYEQLLLHLWGDYAFQNHWMSIAKTKSSPVCLLHAFLYSAPFLLLTQNWKILLIIMGTHYFIDRYRMATWAIKLKNWYWTPSGFPDGTPDYISFWVMVILDNTFHLTINYLALRFG